MGGLRFELLDPSGVLVEPVGLTGNVALDALELLTVVLEGAFEPEEAVVDAGEMTGHEVETVVDGAQLSPDG